MIAIVTIEGVLAQGADLRVARSYKQARPLWAALRSEFQLVGLTRAPAEVARWWLRQESMYDRNWAQIRPWSSDVSLFSWENWRFHEVRNLLADGHEIALCIDQSSNVCEMLHSLQVPVMQMSYPTKALGWQDPEDTVPRPWADVASTVGSGQEVDHGTG